MKKLLTYFQHYGFFFPNAQIYQGLAKAWDCGPLGAQLKKNLKNLWEKYFVNSRSFNLMADTLILTHPQILLSSGHLKNFSDWLVECLNCKKKQRLDYLISPEAFRSFLANQEKANFSSSKCPSCQSNHWDSPQRINLLLNTNLELTENKKKLVYLRPETCQGIFVNFANIQRSSRQKLPFGVGQIGKSFRNEITLQHGVFRTREFEQMELEFFYQEKKEFWYNYWIKQAEAFLLALINQPAKLKKKELTEEELPHYAEQTTDFYFAYHFGWGEICSLSARGDYDLKNHSYHSGVELKTEKGLPQVIEVSFGLERLMLAFLEEAYREEKTPNLERNFLKLHPLLAPYFLAVIPLSKPLVESAWQIYQQLLREINFSVTYEQASGIGKAYRRQDAIGTYYCLTVDFQTLTDQTVTLRERDSTEQTRLAKREVAPFLNQEYQKHYQQLLKAQD